MAKYEVHENGKCVLAGDNPAIAMTQFQMSGEKVLGSEDLENAQSVEVLLHEENMRIKLTREVTKIK